MKDIFITGMGIISAIGRGRAATLQSLLHDRSGIATITRLDTSRREYPAGEVQLSNQEMMQRLSIPQATAITRSALMGAIAIEEALQQAQLHEKGTLRIALVNGTTVGGMDMSEKYYLDFMNNNDRNAYISTHDCGACTEAIADHFGIFTHVETISTACSSAANAILKAAELIRNNRADIVVAGGSECLTRFHLNGFSSLMILDQRPCRPFDAQRSGINLGEGAAYLVIEATETISKRPGTKKLCQLAGYANTCDAFHQTASSPTGEGARLSMTAALKNAGLAPADIDYINAHGTGTDNNDLSEGTAIVEVFRDAMPPVSSTKAYTGHATSAAGSIEAVISILALQHSFIPANRNLAIAMPELPFTPPADARPAKLRHILTNSFGFGGNDTTLIFSACNKDNTIPQPGDGTPTIQSTNNDCTVGSQRLHSRQPTTAQSATNDCTVGNQQLHSRQPTTAQSATNNSPVGGETHNQSQDDDNTVAGSTVSQVRPRHNPDAEDARQLPSTPSPVYILDARQISIQKPLCEEWMDNPILHDSHLAPVIDPDYREYLPPTLSRRSGKLLKRALVVSRSVIEAAGTGCPDAILTGTGFGCVENTEAFLEAMTYEGEACLKPTAFMQSTHNTIGSLIAIDTHCHGYNSTYTHKGTSFECAFMDAYMQITRGQATTALVGGYDELTPHYYSMLSRTGYMGPASGCMGGEAAVSMMLCGNTGNRQPLCRVEGIELHYGSTLDGLGDALQRLTEGAGCTLSSIDAVMTGLNGNAANDAAYRSAARVLFPDTHILMYKHIFGEIRTSAGLAVYASATCLSKGRIPSFLSVGGGSAGSEHGGVQRILLYNHCENRAHSLILLSSC